MKARLILAAILIVIAAAPGRAADKVALLIGNAAYTSVSKLANPVNDVRLIEASLQGHGFDVTRIEDQTLTQMNRALRDFRDKADAAEVAMVYYAGHGIEIGGVNYLIPTDAELTDERDASVEALSARTILRQISGASKLKLMVLDACRDNPFAARMIRAKRGRSVGRGLARTTVAAPDTLIAYAAAAGEITPDGPPGGNSPFSAAFARAMKGPQRDVRQLFGAVRDIMRAEVIGAEPFVYTSLGGANHFIQRASAPAKPAPAATGNVAKDYELAERVGSAAAWRAFLARYGEGEGFYVALARAALAKLQNQPAPATAPVRAATAPLTECDRLAAHHADLQAISDGVFWDLLESEPAIKACRKAVSDYPNVARLEFQLGRSLDKARQYGEAVQQYRRAARLGSAMAMHNVGARYEEGEGVAQNLETAAMWYERAAKLGNSSGMASLAELMVTGRGVDKDVAEATKLYLRAADQGNAWAKNAFGWRLQKGDDLPQDLERAFEFYQDAASSGYGQAMINLGILYNEGNGVEKDDELALSWYLKAAEANHYWGASNVGWSYANGRGVEKNIATAIDWYKKAAARGNTKAMTNIGWYLEKGEGVAEDDVAAREWYEKAALKNFPRAMNNLGALYDTGRGGPVDTQLAGKWLSLAVGWGFEFTRDRLIEKPNTYEAGTRKEIQRRLKSAGHYSGAIDGAFGPGTARAINDYFGVLKE